MISKILDTIISDDLCWSAEQARDLVIYAQHTYKKYCGEPLSTEDIRLFSAGGNPEHLTEAQKGFILHRRTELQQANRRALFHIVQFMGFRELGLVNNFNEYLKIFPPEVPKPLLLTTFERAKEKAG